MAKLDLTFESGEDSLSVRRFSVHETMSGLFSVSILARSPNEDIDLETIVGRPASFHASNGVAFALSGARSLHGICCQLEQLAAETTGLSTYHLRIAPKLWLLEQKTNHRLFQHLSIPNIVEKLLKEWDIPHAFMLNRDEYPRLELRVQYGESDLDFIQRLLEEAGISYHFTETPPGKRSTSPSLRNLVSPCNSSWIPNWISSPRMRSSTVCSPRPSRRMTSALAAVFIKASGSCSSAYRQTEAASQSSSELLLTRGCHRRLVFFHIPLGRWLMRGMMTPDRLFVTSNRRMHGRRLRRDTLLRRSSVQ